MSRLLVVVSIAVAITVAACSSDGESEPTTSEATAAATGEPAADEDVVEVHYRGTLDDGEQFDSSYDRGTPLVVNLGEGGAIPGFEDAVRGLRVGETITVRLEPAEAYGERNESLIVEVPFGPSQSDVAVGDLVTLNNGAPAVVLEVREQTVLLDANHRLAGKALTFEIEVVAITRG
jgi:FKBP-type peptidyl-prolyl cis-trans isomerase 2